MYKTNQKTKYNKFKEKEINTNKIKIKKEIQCFELNFNNIVLRNV